MKQRNNAVHGNLHDHGEKFRQTHSSICKSIATFFMQGLFSFAGAHDSPNPTLSALVVVSCQG